MNSEQKYVRNVLNIEVRTASEALPQILHNLEMSPRKAIKKNLRPESSIPLSARECNLCKVANGIGRPFYLETNIRTYLHKLRRCGPQRF